MSYLRNAPVRPRRPSVRRFHCASMCGPIGACTYLAGCALPLPWDIPLVVLALLSVLALVSGFRNSPSSWSPIVLHVLIFFVAMAFSTLVSVDVGRSVWLSAPILPAVLLFFVVAEQFGDIRDTRLLYLTFSAVGLGLASMLLWAAWKHGVGNPTAIVLALGSPILLVPNDSTVLAVIAPLSLALLSRERRGVGGLVAGLSLLVSASAVVVLQSRTALLTMLASLTCAAVLMHPRRRLAFSLGCSLMILALTLLIDGVLGFPLVTKSIHAWQGSGRIPLWQAAWAMFRDAPWLGHGPHTFVLLYKAYLHDLGLSISPVIVPWTHNLYLEVLAEQGLVGFAALGALLACGISTAWTIHRTASGDSRHFGAAALGGVMGFCCAAVVESSFLRQWVVITLFTLLGVIAQLSSGQTTTRRVD